ncbi:MAG: nucleoside triphosphate pyrophosphohydrolase [Rhodospirillales bacterium]|nr:nucleoside triphosphate pyrophosphohydrolase [Rhodospirillales bacterium]
MSIPTDAAAPLLRLLAIMAKLRDCDGGCAWDVEQTFRTIAPYTIEEAYEVANAIENEDWPSLKDELGDLLFQVVFHAQMASEDGHFAFDDVVRAISDKMIRRHPHVFGDQTGIDSANAQTVNWEAQKAAERKAKAEQDGRCESALDGVTPGLPALIRAAKLQKRAARVGFDWTDADHVLADVDEEFDELKSEIQQGSGHDRLEDEMGDLLFSIVNLARHLGIDPESALRRTNAKFETRFRYVEDCLAADGRTTSETTLEEMDTLWNEAKIGAS